MKALIEDIASSDVAKAELAKNKLITQRDPACLRDLLPLALSSDIEVQSRAVMVLSHFVATRHLTIWNFLRPILLRGSSEMKTSALIALEDLPVGEAVPVLKHIAMNGGNIRHRAHAVGCLSSIARVRPKLRSGLRGIFEKATTSRSSCLRLAGLEGLNDFNDRRYDQLFLAAREDADPGIRARYETYARTIKGRKGSASPKALRS